MFHLCGSSPVRHASLPAQKVESEKGYAAQAVARATSPIANETLIFGLLALVLSIAAGIGSIVVVHLVIFLQARGVDFAVAVSLGAIFGPAQVGARVVESLFGKRYHPIWTMIASLHTDGGRFIIVIWCGARVNSHHLALWRGLRNFVDRTGAPCRWRFSDRCDFRV